MRSLRALVSISLASVAFATFALGETGLPPGAVLSGQRIDRITLTHRTGKATHRVYLGSCDRGTVHVTAYKVPGYLQVDVAVMTHREGGELYAGQVDENTAEFVILRGGSKWSEHHYSKEEIWHDLRKTAPNLRAAYLNDMWKTGMTRKEMVEAEVLRPYEVLPLPTDCVLSDADKRPLGEWEKLPN